MKLSAVLLAACLVALPVWAAGSLDALRSSSQSTRAQVTALRAEQLKQRNELSTLSAQIETLKASSKGKLLPGSELDSALKRSQELSGVLSDLASQLSTRETELETANLALLDGLSAELTRLRSEFDRQSDRTASANAARKNIINQLRQLRAERDALRQTLPASKIPTLDAVRPSDDPEELLEQADLLRDNEEKLRKELKAVEARIAERREEVELDRRMQRFMGEESMFDDGDRRLRVQRTVTTPGTAPTAQEASNGTTPPPAAVGATSDTSAGSTGSQFTSSPFGAQSLGTPAAPGVGRTQADGTSFGNGLDNSSIRVTNASDARVQIGNAPRSVSGGDDDLEDLEVERVRLQGLAGQLKKKADELQKRAAELK